MLVLDREHTYERVAAIRLRDEWPPGALRDFPCLNHALILAIERFASTGLRNVLFMAILRSWLHGSLSVSPGRLDLTPQNAAKSCGSPRSIASGSTQRPNVDSD